MFNLLLFQYLISVLLSQVRIGMMDQVMTIVFQIKWFPPTLPYTIFIKGANGSLHFQEKCFNASNVIMEWGVHLKVQQSYPKRRRLSAICVTFYTGQLPTFGFSKS